MSLFYLILVVLRLRLFGNAQSEFFQGSAFVISTTVEGTSQLVVLKTQNNYLRKIKVTLTNKIHA